MKVALFLIALAVLFAIVAVIWTAMKWALILAVGLFLVGVVSGLLKRAKG